MFLMIDESDHVTGLTGLSPTVTLSKAGGSFASPAGSVSEVGNGWYKVAGNATDTGTLGPLVLHATATGADPFDREYDVVEFDPQLAAIGALMPTTAGRTLDVSATGEAGLDWSNVGTPSAAVNLSATTVATLAGHTAQTGDSYARLGAPAGASISADIAAVNTKTTNLPSDPADQSLLIAATDAIVAILGTPAGASLAADIAATGGLDAAGVRAAVGLASANLDTQLGNAYSRLGAPVGASISADIAGVKTNTTAIAAKLPSKAYLTGTGNADGDLDMAEATGAFPGNVGGLVDKSGMKLASDGLDSIAVTAPGGVASTFPQMVVQTWRRFFKKVTKTSTQFKTYADDGTTVVTTQTLSDNGTTQTFDAAA